MTLSYVLLAVGIICYGCAGVRLSEGSQHEAGALRSVAWWTGTGLQAAGFLLTFVARQDLPLLFVQGAVVAGLAVTAVVGQFTGMHRLAGADFAAILAMVAGLTALGISTQPGPTAQVSRWTVPVLLVSLAVALLALVGRWPAGILGVASGVGFGVGAVAARLLAAAPGHVFWHFWQWGIQDWVHAFLIPGGIVVGQLFLTRGLATGGGVATLGAEYLASTVWPIVVGLLLLHEVPRPHTGVLLVFGLVATMLGALRLLRFENSVSDGTVDR